MSTQIRKTGRKLMIVTTLLITSLLSGCLAMTIAGVGAAGAATYFYLNGKVCQDYPANFEETWAALHSSLAESRFPVVSEKAGRDKGILTSRTGDGTTIDIDVETTAPRIPAQGATTRICIRVGTFGDEPTSQKILDGVGMRLLSPPGSPAIAPRGPEGAPPAPPAPPPERPGPPRGGNETSEPPLAPRK